LTRETKINPLGLDIGGTTGKPPADGSGTLLDAMKGPLECPGGA
jgi:hypothetical protein